MSVIDHPGTFKLGSRAVKPARLRRHAARRPRRVRAAQGPEAALAVLREAVASGVNHIDTSDFYGPHVTNQLIREALHPVSATTSSSSPRSARGATTTPAWLPAFSPEELDAGRARQPAATSGSTCSTWSTCAIMFDVHGPAEGSIEGARSPRWPTCSARAWCAISA